MADFQAFLVITLLTWAAVSVSGTTKELSTTTGDTVSISCDFGEGTLRNIFWYHNNGTASQKILSLFRGKLDVEAEYTDRASLQSDNLTLILNDTTVSDQGTYQCDVDRQGQTAVPNINTKLNVFSLRPDTLPMILGCTGADESSSCSIHANQSLTLTCTLPNVHPVNDTELIWYQDGKHVPSTHDATQNDDGTTDISRQIQVSKTGNFTCNATYHSANGRENTAVSVEAWIVSPADVPNIPDKNLTGGQIAGIAIGIIVLLVVIPLCIYCLKTRGLCCFRKDNKKRDETELNQAGDGDPTTPQDKNDDSHQDQVTTEASLLLKNLPENGSQNGNAGDGDPTTPQNRNDDSEQDQVNTIPIEEPDFDKLLIALVKKIPDDTINELGKELGFDAVEIERYVATNSRFQNVTCSGTLAMLRDWDKKQTKATEQAALKEALMNARLVRLADEFFP